VQQQQFTDASLLRVRALAERAVCSSLPVMLFHLRFARRMCESNDFFGVPSFAIKATNPFLLNYTTRGCK
jgi:hypothetical protein